MVEDVTKWSSRLIEPEHVSAAIKYAYDIASSQRKGPVWLDIPMNIQASAISIDDLVDYNYGTTKIGEPQGPEKPILSKMEGVPSILSLLERAERPVLWLGHGVRLSGAESKVLELVDELGIPVLVSWQACDILDSEHELCFGRAGVYGQRAANFVLQNCDALICIGTRLAIPQVGYDLTEFARAAEIALVDVDIDELLKHGERIQLPICSDAGEFIDEIMKMITNKFQREKWLEQCNKYRNNFPLIGQEHSDLTDEDGITYINSYRFMKVLESYFHERQIVVTDMGTALLSGHQVLNFKSGQRMLTSTGLGEMGFGLPGAIGAAIASNRDVLCLNCDGGMMLNLQELQTIVHHNLPIKIIIFNNDGYLMIKHTQKALFDGRYIATDAKSGVTCPNYTKVAHAFDMPSFQIRTWDDAEEVLPKLQELQGPAICEVFTHPEQLFVPKLSLAQKEDGTIVSPPLEDLSPLLSRDDLSENMLIGMHQKSIDLS
jgi:acetolactate synthase-1/2/3 large subunit